MSILEDMGVDVDKFMKGKKSVLQEPDPQSNLWVFIDSVQDSDSQNALVFFSMNSQSREGVDGFKKNTSIELHKLPDVTSVIMKKNKTQLDELDLEDEIILDSGKQRTSIGSNLLRSFRTDQLR